MAGPGNIQVPPDSSGQRVDVVSLSVAGVNVVRQVMALASGLDGQTLAEVAGGSASTSAVGIVVRPTTATVALVTGSTIGISSISGLPAVAISGTATVAGNVNISTMPAVNISTMPSVAINAISAGISINVGNISATATVQYVAPAAPSASRGPRCVTASTSANVTLIPSPGAGASIRVTMLSMHNASANFASLRFGTSASIMAIVVPAASSGGGAVFNFNPPIMLSASEAALCSIKPNGSYAVFNVHYYVV